MESEDAREETVAQRMAPKLLLGTVPFCRFY